MEIYFAVSKVGAVLVPLNTRLVGSELQYQLNNADCKLLVFHNVFMEEIDKIRSQIGVEADKYIYLKDTGKDGAKCPEWAVDYHDLMGKYSSDEPFSNESIEGDQPLVIMYTSGTTGAPRVRFCHIYRLTLNALKTL
jgi:fatty-acyl-CoA synthase